MRQYHVYIQKILTAVVLVPAMLVITGTLVDDAIAKRVDVCISAASARGPYVYFLPLVMTSGSAAAPSIVAWSAPASCSTVAVDPGNASTGQWSYQLPRPGSIDGGYQSMWISGFDAAGNQSASQRIIYRVDTVAPQLAVTETVTRVSLAAYQASPYPLLRGTARDGSGTVNITVRARRK